LASSRQYSLLISIALITFLLVAAAIPPKNDYTVKAAATNVMPYTKSTQEESRIAFGKASLEVDTETSTNFQMSRI
jgi:hypothetical protein